jgi:hypothetical protein
MHYSVLIFLTKGVFVVNFPKNSSAVGVCGTSLLGRWGGEKVKLSLACTQRPVLYDHCSNSTIQSFSTHHCPVFIMN